MFKGDTLDCFLHSHAYQILGEAAQAPPEVPLTVRAARGDLAVRIEVAPSHPPGKQADGKVPGRHLSDVEQLIWDALAERPLIGKQIASKIAHEYDSSLKVLLRNLVNRRVIVPDQSGGYARASANDLEGN